MNSGSMIKETATLRRRSRGKNVVAVASGKGGVGKTWFSITLAHAMANKGARTLLFDGDLGLANLDIQLGLMPKNDLGAVVSGNLSLGQAVTPSEEINVDIIAGRSGRIASIPTNRLQLIGNDLALLAAAYDQVVVDLGAGVEKTVRVLANAIGAIIVLVTDEPTSLTDAYAFIGVAHMERPGTDFKIVVNMANSAKEGEQPITPCSRPARFSNLPPRLGVVRRDPKVREAIRAQTSIITRFPNTEAVRDVSAIAANLRIGAMPPDLPSDIGSAPPPPPPGGGAVATPAQIQQVLPNPPRRWRGCPLASRWMRKLSRSSPATGDDVETRVA